MSHVERTQKMTKAVASAAAARDAKLAELARDRAEALAAHDRAVDAARADAKRARDRAAEAIVSYWHKKSAPLCQSYLAEPSRKVAIALSNLWIECQARAAEELGEPLTDYLAVFSVADVVLAAFPGAVSRFGSDDFGLHGAAAKARMLAGALVAQAAPEIEAAIDALDRDLTAAARTAPLPAPDSHQRYAARRAAATHGDLHDVSAAHDAAIETEKRATALPANIMTERPTWSFRIGL